MRIEGTNSMGAGMQTWMSEGTDAESKRIQKQIQSKQEELQKLSEKEDISLEEKMKKRQEIQKEIADLQGQLRKHQIEQRKAEQQKKGTSMEDTLGGEAKVRSKSKSGKDVRLSQSSMKAMISAGSAMQQAQVQGSVSDQMEGRAGVLEAEIKRDKAFGDTAAKEAELAEVNEIAMNAESAQMASLSKANEIMDQAAEEEGRQEGAGSDKPESGRTGAEKTSENGRTGRQEDKIQDKGAIAGETVNGEDAATDTDVRNTVPQGMEMQNGTAKIPVKYVPVDIRL